MGKVKAVLRGVLWVVVIAVAVQIASLAVKGAAMDGQSKGGITGSLVGCSYRGSGADSELGS
nr:MAG TPA: hypothetical protein [Caudoviricetes sp.]